MYNVNWEYWNSDNHYSEAEQPFPVKMAFCDEYNNVITPRYSAVQCRDFLVDDLIWSQKLTTKDFDSSPSLYYFSIEKVGPLKTDKTRIMVTNKYVSPSRYNPFNKQLLLDIHRIYNLPEPIIINYPNKKAVLVISDKWWLSTTIHLSFFTFLLKRCYEKVSLDSIFSKVKNNERNFDVAHVEKIFRVLPKMDNLPLMPFDSEVKTMHDLSGFNSLCNPYISSEHSKKFQALVEELQQ